MTRHKQFKRSLEYINNKFQTQVTEEPTRGDAAEPHALNQQWTGQWCEDQGILGCRVYEMMEFKLIKGAGQGKTEGHNLGLQEGKLCPAQGSDWKNPFWYGHGANRGSGELVDFEGSPSAISRKVHPSVQEKKQMHINTWWAGGVKKMEPVFSVLPNDRRGVNGHKLNYSKFHLNIRKNGGIDWTLEEAGDLPSLEIFKTQLNTVWRKLL